jgi:LacI family transcriptional regulator
MWSSTALTDERPKYRQIAADLMDQIREGEYPPGELLPTLTQLGERYAVSQITVRQAMRLLIEQGLVRTVPGKGTIATGGASREKPCVEHRVGVLIPSLPCWSELFTALCHELHSLGHDILMKPLAIQGDFHSQVEQARFELEAVRATCGSGLIMFGDRLLVETFLRDRPPDQVGVCLESRNGIPSTIPMASTDNFGGTFVLTRHLLSLGHRQIAYLEAYLLRDTSSDRMDPGTTHEQRFAGYRAAMRSAGLAPYLPREFLTALLEPGNAEDLARLFRRPAMPTAMLCFNDTVAERAYAALTAAGIAVPAEISLAGYDNVSKLRGGDWLTSLDQNGPELARQLVRLIHGEPERLRYRRGEAAPRILVPPILHLRDSVAPPPE